jgi:hypothetical protein
VTSEQTFIEQPTFAVFYCELCHVAVSQHSLFDMAYLFAAKGFAPAEVVWPLALGLTHEDDFLPAENRRPKWARWSMKPWGTADGRIGGALLFSTMITDWVDARRSLRATANLRR